MTSDNSGALTYETNILGVPIMWYIPHTPYVMPKEIKQSNCGLFCVHDEVSMGQETSVPQILKTKNLPIKVDCEISNKWRK